MKIAIVGSRGFSDYNLLKETLKSYENKNVEIVSGGAKGADRLGERWAKEFNKPIKIFIPDWNAHGKAAGFKRNKLIIDYCDIAFAFWDGSSNGTRHSINLCHQNHKEIHVINYNTTT